jgi:hypothetical protein
VGSSRISVWSLFIFFTPCAMASREDPGPQVAEVSPRRVTSFEAQARLGERSKDTSEHSLPLPWSPRHTVGQPEQRPLASSPSCRGRRRSAAPPCVRRQQSAPLHGMPTLATSSSTHACSQPTDVALGEFEGTGSASREKSKEPAMSSDALTDKALRKSEELLAEMVALGLSDEDDPHRAAFESKLSVDTTDDSICPSPTSQPSHVALKGNLDTVEMPVVLVDKLVDMWQKYRNLRAVSCEAPAAQESDMWKQPHCHLDAEVASALSATMDDTGSVAGSHISTAASLSSGNLSPRDVLRSKGGAPKAAMCAEATKSTSQLIRVARATAFAQPQSPRHVQSPRQVHPCSPRQAIAPPKSVVTSGSVRAPLACALVQQTINITNTYHVYQNP